MHSIKFYYHTSEISFQKIMIFWKYQSSVLHLTFNVNLLIDKHINCLKVHFTFNARLPLHYHTIKQVNELLKKGIVNELKSKTLWKKVRLYKQVRTLRSLYSLYIENVVFLYTFIVQALWLYISFFVVVYTTCMILGNLQKQYLQLFRVTKSGVK